MFEFISAKRMRMGYIFNRKDMQHNFAANENCDIAAKDQATTSENINRNTMRNVYTELGSPEAEVIVYPPDPPPPAPPVQGKSYIYKDPSNFSQVDQVAIDVAQDYQNTFGHLISHLIANSSSDIDKVRAIFRWITVKNLNLLHFDDNANPGTPFGILRGIKHGTGSYHILFKRLCSLASLHCVVIKGYSKSAGYKPGVEFNDNQFRNSWNAVYVDNAWRFVQCNWGARHLVSAKEIRKLGEKSVDGNVEAGEKLCYEFDDHYFLTDPEEFIYEFYPLQSQWQLLRRPITIQEFAELPFVRSAFFRYGLWFPDEAVTKAVISTDQCGAATVRIGVPLKMMNKLIFHYNLQYCNREGDACSGGVHLNRFVMQCVMDNNITFRVHAPLPGTYLLEIFANVVSPTDCYVAGDPMKFQNVCKFRVDCKQLHAVMVPLPECANGEWGPAKAVRLFGLTPLTHRDALLFTKRQLQIDFRMMRPLADFMALLHKNGSPANGLVGRIRHMVRGDTVSFFILFPEDGQFGLDIYTRDPKIRTNRDSVIEETRMGKQQFLTHCCKFLINVTS